MRNRVSLSALIIAGLILTSVHATAAPGTPRFEISYAASAHQGPITGRLILILSTKAEPEPRLGIVPRGPAIFGIDLDRVRPGQSVAIDARTIGYPTGLAELPPGDYYAQALIVVYMQVHRVDGHTIWVPINDGSEVELSEAAGNLYSDVRRIHIGDSGTVRLEITRVIPPAPVPADTEWVKRVKIKSEKLTRFWGRPTFIYATVLLPKGYAEHPDVRYPSVYTLGHGVPFFFSTEPSKEEEDGKINPRTGLESGYDFYQTWKSDRLPRFVALTLEHQTPYFLDSYAVNSANNGPYGDAIVEEVIPYLEKQFRIIAKPYARLIEGASTSGWQTLALQLRNPEFFGGAWVLQPDPIDFRHYQLVDIYQDENAFSTPSGEFVNAERPFLRWANGQVRWTERQLSLFEHVLDPRGRSQSQLQAWEAVYGPVGPDGYPKPLWDKLTGKIDREVAHYMRDNGYDLRAYAEQHWATIGPKLIGKLHFFCGDMDDFHLNLGVYDFEEFLKGTTDPHYEGEFTYGRPMKGHGWHAWTWGELVRQLADYVKRTAPAGENVSAWNY